MRLLLTNKQILKKNFTAEIAESVEKETPRFLNKRINWLSLCYKFVTTKYL